jgi:TRAP-type C4-dicarboxylate transport system permease small subunit
MRMLAVGLDVISTVMRVLAAVLLVASVGLNLFNILDRFLVATPIQWGEEVMLFLMVGIVFFGAVAISAQGRHIRMDIVIALAPKPIRHLFNLLAVLAEGAAAAAVAWIGIPVVMELADFDERATASDLPMWIPQALVPFGLSLIALICLARLALLVSGHRATARVAPGPGSAETAAVAGG